MLIKSSKLVNFSHIENGDSFSAIEDTKVEVQNSGWYNEEFYEVLFKVFPPPHQGWTADENTGEDSEELDLPPIVDDKSSCRLGHLHIEAGKTPWKTGHEGNIVAIEDTML